jgi:hypothetical protein
VSTNIATTTNGAPMMPAQIITADREAILRFLQMLWPEGPGKHYINVWLPPGNSRWFGGATSEAGSLLTLEMAADYIAAHPVNAHVGMCLGDRDHGPQHRLSRTEGRLAHAAHGLWMDVDLRGAAHTSKNYPTSLEQVVEILHRAGLANFMPTFAVFTGGGWHVYWLFREPLFFAPASDPRFDDRDIFCSILRRLQRLIRDTAAAMGLGLDPTHDPERVLRPTGTIRAKDGCEANVTTFFEPLSSGRRYNQADLVELLDMMGVVDEDDEHLSPAEVGPIKANPRAAIDQETFRAMGDVDATLKQIWALQKPLGKTPPAEDSFSERDAQLCGWLAYWSKFPPQQIVDWLIVFRREKAKPGHQRMKHLQYYAITVGKALAWAAKKRAELERSKNAATRKQVQAEDAAKTEQQANQAAESRTGALAVLYDVLGKRSVTRMVVLTDNGKKVYQIEIDAKLITVGDIGAIFSAELTSRAVWQETGRAFPPMKKKSWVDVVLPALHTIRQEINLDEDNGRVRRWLYDWFPTGGRLVSTEDDFERAVGDMVSGELSFRLSGFAKLYGDYGCIIRAHRFTSWVRQVGEDGNEETATTIRQKLIAVGFERKESHTVTFRDDTRTKLRDVFVGVVDWFRTFQSGEGKQLSEPENTD